MDEAALIRRCRAGDMEAFASLFEAHYARACRTALGIARDRALAEDIAQEAFVQAFRALGNVREGEPFAPWFYRLLVRLARRMVRPRRFLFISLENWREQGGEVADPEAEAILDEVAGREQVWQALGQLGLPHREVLVLRYLADLSEADIAVAADIPPGTVKSRLFHARRLLAAALRRQAAHPAPATKKEALS